MSRQKTLGRIDGAILDISSFNAASGRVTLKVANLERSVLVESSAWCAARRLVDVAREIVDQQRRHAEHERYIYEQLRDYTGCKPPEASKHA